MYYAELEIWDRRNGGFSFNREPLLKMSPTSIDDYLDYIKKLPSVTNVVITKTHHIHLPREVKVEFDITNFPDVHYVICIGTIYYWVSLMRTYSEVYTRATGKPDPKYEGRVGRILSNFETVDEFKKEA